MKKSEWFSCRCITLLYLVLCIFCLNFPPALSESTYHIKLSESTIELAKGKSIRILAEVDGLKTKFCWSSENPLIAAVSTTGTVTAKGNGTTTITCSASINEKEIRESVVINVYTPVQGIKLPQSISIDAGKSTEPLTITFSPADASNQQVKWTSDNTSVVVVDENGVITGVSAGTCKVTAVSMDTVIGSAKPKSASIKVSVLQPVNSIDIDKPSLTLAVGKSDKVAAKVLPENANNKKITWKSDNSSTAIVKNGTVTGKAVGDTIISVYTHNSDGSEIRKDIPVHVYAPVTTVSIKNKQKGVSLYPGESISLDYDIAPSNAEFTDVKWESSDKTIASVNSVTGTVKGMMPGQVTVTATSTEPLSGKGIAKKDTIKIKVLVPVKSFSFISPTVVLSNERGRKITIKDISPGNATNKKVFFNSSNRSIADVSDQGILDVDDTGVVTIEMKAQDGQGAEQTAKIWCFDSKKTVTEKNRVFKNTTSALNKLKDSVTSMKTLSDMVSKKSDVKDTADKTFASFMSAIGVTYLYSQFANRNKEETSMSCSAKKPSYCFIGGKQIWCFFAKDNSSNYEGYGYIKVPEGQLYLTHITLSAIFADNYLNERFDDEFVSYEVPGDILMAELRATANRLK